MNNENLPQKRAKENIFLKIKKWFKSMLNIKGNVEDIVQNSFLLTKSENNFNETLKVGNVDYILKLHDAFLSIIHANQQ